MSTAVQHRQLLTVEETAQRLRVSEKTVRRLIDRAELPALRVGGQIRIDSGELGAWLYGTAARSFLLSPAAAENPAVRRQAPEETSPAVEARRQSAGVETERRTA